MADISGQQPYIHDQIICVAAPALAISGHDGQMTRDAHGFYLGDRRVLCRLLLTVDGVEPEPLLGHQAGSGGARFVGVLRLEPTADPVIVVERLREARAARERVVIRNHGRRALRLRVDVWLGCDLADLTEIKSGARTTPLPARRHPGGVGWNDPRHGARVRVIATPTPDAIDGEHLLWSVDIDPGGTWSAELAVDVRQDAAALPVATPTGTPPWERPSVTCDDPRMTELLRQSLDDLEGLALADPDDTDDVFLAAGSPWFLTLFGRDSLWAARMLLPLGTRLAAGTLRALARRQGTKHDAWTDEAPGTIMHELRHRASTLPPLSYSSVDATPLFVCLLADAWRWGMPESEVAALLPAAVRALEAVREGVARGGGFLRYQRARPGGLSNQGWKDSPDAVQFADGTLADPPVALCEVQGYAYEAAMSGADLLDAFDSGAGHGRMAGGERLVRRAGDEWREWASALRERFHRSFWVPDERGLYVAVALDGRGRPVDGVASNMGHLPGTGILDDAQVAAVAGRLAAPDMHSGWGLRTMSAQAPRFNALGYHTGSVWTHDTAIAVAGLAACGRHGESTALVEGLLAAAPHFDYRLPELFGGEQRRRGFPPLPYPPACRPQAWAAAAAVALVTAVVGLRPDVPHGRITLAPMRPSPVGALQAHGLRVGTGTLSVRVDATGEAAVVEAPQGLTTRSR